MAFIDYYKILGVSKTSTEKEIKKAYRKKARKYHPDLNPNDKVAAKKFREINEANEVLSNPENRKKYDTYGENWEEAEQYEKARQQRQSQQQSSQGRTGGFSEEEYSSFFESMFGGGAHSSGSWSSRARAKFRGSDYNAELHLSLKDVFRTQKHTLTVNGKNIRLTIPAGVKSGQIIKIKGHGGPGANGGPKGDLFITFFITNPTKFRRDNDDLYTTVDLDLYKAILGGDIEVDTFDGKVKLKVKPSTQNGTKVKLKGKGFPKYKKKGKFGDLYITYQIKIPTNLTAREKELFKELANQR